MVKGPVFKSYVDGGLSCCLFLPDLNCYCTLEAAGLCPGSESPGVVHVPSFSIRQERVGQSWNRIVESVSNFLNTLADIAMAVAARNNERRDDQA